MLDGSAGWSTERRDRCPLSDAGAARIGAPVWEADHSPSSCYAKVRQVPEAVARTFAESFLSDGPTWGAVFPDAFVWERETDSRRWVAGNLRDYLARSLAEGDDNWYQ
ncbi:hypothetical protein [Streptomyces sp. NPDC051993]|uniref:hypothetical protein n=1 Tax=unclassified Streptomyces TaxID=2593676 RepID=UPI0034336C25